MAKTGNAQNIVKVSPAALAASAKAASRKGMPPVHLWDPPFCGDIDMRIARDGTWYYLGTPIARAPLVQLFSTILRKDGEQYFLVTPVEKVGITVDDAPFVAVDFDVTREAGSQCLAFTTNVGDLVLAGPDNPIRVETDPISNEPSPYIRVRANLDALIDRKSFYRLVELGEEREVDRKPWFGVRSRETFFPIAEADALRQA
jgi:hypothetical protein